MGEILRAVLDRSCIFSAPTFYTVEHVFGAIPAQPQTQYIEAKKDREFLIMALNFTALFNADGVPSLILPTCNYQISLLRANRTIYNGPINGVLLGGDNRNIFTLPEYILVGSNETIAVQVIPNDPNLANRTLSLTFNGIEYGK